MIFVTPKQHGTTWQPPALDRERPGYEIRLQLAKRQASVVVVFSFVIKIQLRESWTGTEVKTENNKKPPPTQASTDGCVGLREEIVSQANIFKDADFLIIFSSH